MKTLSTIGILLALSAPAHSQGTKYPFLPMDLLCESMADKSLVKLHVFPKKGQVRIVLPRGEEHNVPIEDLKAESQYKIDYVVFDHGILVLSGDETKDEQPAIYRDKNKNVFNCIVEEDQ